MLVVVDTSLFVSAIKGGELRSAEARRFFRTIDDPESMLIPVTVMVELGAVIKRQTGSTPIAERVVASIESWPSLLIVDDFSEIRHHLLNVSSVSGLKGMDAMVLATAVAYDVPLLTFDREMTRRSAVFTRIISIQEVLDDFEP